MKRFLALLLAAGLILAFSMPAAAADVKFSGQYTYEGWYDHQHTLKKDAGSSVGFEDHSLLLNMQFKVAEGLALYTRARVLDKIWGDIPTTTGGSTPTDVRDRTFAGEGNRYLRENIEFDYLYIQAKFGPGALQIGSAPSMLGTPFLDTDNPTNQFAYFFLTKSYYLGLCYEKYRELEVTLPTSSGPTFSNRADTDSDRFKLTGILFRPTWDAGATAYYLRSAINRTVNITTKLWVIDPYVRATFGPLYVEAEGVYIYGKNQEFENATPDVDRRGYSAYAKARYTFGPAYVGAAFAYVSGDDPGTTDKVETGGASGREFKPALILLNPDRDKWLGALGTGGNAQVLGNNYTGDNSTYYGGAVNFAMYQGFIGFKPIPKLELVGTYTYANLNEKGANVDDSLGSEFDITASYKIYDNLTYMVGFGYLWAGDAWKGTSAANETANDWLLMHRLTLTF